MWHTTLSIYGCHLAWLTPFAHTLYLCFHSRFYSQKDTKRKVDDFERANKMANGKLSMHLFIYYYFLGDVKKVNMMINETFFFHVMWKGHVTRATRSIHMIKKYFFFVKKEILGLHIARYYEWQSTMGEKMNCFKKKLSSILNENIEWHCMQLELCFNSIQIELNWIQVFKIWF